MEANDVNQEALEKMRLHLEDDIKARPVQLLTVPVLRKRRNELFNIFIEAGGDTEGFDAVWPQMQDEMIQEGTEKQSGRQSSQPSREQRRVLSL